MVEECGAKAKEKLQIYTENGMSGPISLDQARAMALRHARDHRDFYGHRYAALDLVWVVLSQKERRDYHDIRLSFQPAEGFNGKPGVERFTFDKWGAMRDRVVLVRPVERKSLLLPGIAVATIVIAGADVAGFFAAGVFPVGSETAPLPSASVFLASDAASQLVSPQNDVTIVLDAGSVAEAVQLLFQPLPPEAIPQLPPGYEALSKAFDLSVASTGLETDESYVFMKPITITVNLSAEDLAAAGDEANVVIQHYRGGGRGWEPLPTIVDLEVSIATAQVDELSIFALTIGPPAPAPAAVSTAAATSIAPDPGIAPTPTVESTPMPVPSATVMHTPLPAPTTASGSTSSPQATQVAALTPAQTATPTNPVAAPATGSTPAPDAVPVPAPTTASTLAPTPMPAPVSTPTSTSAATAIPVGAPAMGSTPAPAQIAGPHANPLVNAGGDRNTSRWAYTSVHGSRYAAHAGSNAVCGIVAGFR